MFSIRHFFGLYCYKCVEGRTSEVVNVFFWVPSSIMADYDLHQVLNIQLSLSSGIIITCNGDSMKNNIIFIVFLI